MDSRLKMYNVVRVDDKELMKNHLIAIISITNLFMFKGI